MMGCSVYKNDSTKAARQGNLEARCPDLESPVVGQSIEGYTTYVIDEYHKCASKDDALLSADPLAYYSTPAFADEMNAKANAKKEKEREDINPTLSNISQVH